MTGQDPAVAAAAGLAGSLDAMTRQMERLSRSGRRSRRVIAALAASFALDLIVTGGLAYNTVRQNDIQAATHASDIRQCQLANVGRQQDIAIWNRLLQVPASAPASARAEVADLERLVRVKDMPRDCAAAYAK